MTPAHFGSLNGNFWLDLGDDPQPLDIFYYLFDDNMWQILVDEKNRYAEKVIENMHKL